MIALLLNFLFIPICATFAGFVVWAGSGKESLDDGALVRQFLFFLVVSMAVVWGASRSDFMRLRLDPQFRIQTELDAHPLYAAVDALTPDEHKVLQAMLVGEMLNGGTLADALLQARPLLTRMTTERLGFSDQKSKVAWGAVTAAALSELQTRDPLLCYRAMSSEPLDRQTLNQVFSTDNTRVFQQAVIDVYKSASLGMRNQRSPEDQPTDFNDAKREYGLVREGLVQRFGEPIAKQLDKKGLPQPPTESPEQMCAARIAQLEAMLGRSQAMASILIDSVLRR